jgi:mono/diheme cytochrome c family protein
MKRSNPVLFSLFLLAALVLAACTSFPTSVATPTEAVPGATSAPTATTAPAATNTPASPSAATATPSGSAQVSYSKDIQPIFTQNCVRCHGGRGGLYLDSYAHVMAGGVTGPVIVPGSPQDSLLVKRIEGIVQPQMPLGGPPLSQADINLIVNWIAEGAPDN